MPGQLAVVEQATTALHKVKDYIDNGMDSTLEIINDIIVQEKDVAAEDIQTKTAEIRGVMLRYASNDIERTRFLEAIEHAKKFVRDGGDIMDMEKEMDRKLKLLQEDETSVNDHPKVKEMTEKLEELLQQAEASVYCVAAEEAEAEGEETELDEDIAITQGVLNTKCPYTGKAMVRPMRNKHCGHHYDHAGFQEMCRKRSRPKCPIPGCLYQSPLSMADLEDDLKMKTAIEAKNRSHKKT